MMSLVTRSMEMRNGCDALSTCGGGADFCGVGACDGSDCAVSPVARTTMEAVVQKPLFFRLIALNYTSLSARPAARATSVAAAAVATSPAANIA